MMSTTPETDKIVAGIIAGDPDAAITVEYARKLERERDEWKERYAKAYGRLAGALAERDEARRIAEQWRNRLCGHILYCREIAAQIEVTNNPCDPLPWEHPPVNEA